MITKERGLWCSLPGGCCISWQLPLVRKGRSLGAKLLMGPSCLWTWWGDACPSGAALQQAPYMQGQSAYETLAVSSS